ncbi:uncharacterized protein SAZU_8280 [Streptomyces azureus]|uniref:DUF4429 domain-containing protein n=1 Tax=Streptomyces azureus TaxID=146537 RepID=A0A0K8Q0Z8_STRAJ|nr:uncharacterized protein SAZU_8280 [Streptomyces azureus]
MDVDRTGVAEYVAEEIRRSLLLDRIPKEPAKACLLHGPPVPVPVRSSDGTVSFDGSRVRIDWADTSERVKRATGPRIINLGDLVQVEWLPNSGHEDGFLRFVTRETVFSKLPPEKDPYALVLWGSARRDLLTALIGTAVTARLPHPSTRTSPGNHEADAHGPSPAPAVPPAADHHDVVLRRLRELGELYRDGVLTGEEFALAKAAVLRGF